jgi:hypothetical protein
VTTPGKICCGVIPCKPSSSLTISPALPNDLSVTLILVPFRGDGEGVDELTWGQVALWHGMSISGRSNTMAGVAALPPGTTVEDMADLLRFIVSRHQALRTRLRFRPDNPRPLQVCVTSGEVPLEVVDAGDDDPAEVAERVKGRYQSTNFDYEHEFPVRLAVIRRDGRVTHLVGVYLHLMLDAGGLAALMADITAREPVTGVAAGPVTAVQPLEQARRQRTAGALRHSVAAMVFQEKVLRTMLPNQFGEPRYADRGMRMIRYRSPAAALAIRRIAGQQNATTSSALLAVFAVALARHTGQGSITSMVMVSNRFRPGFTDSVSPVAQLSPFQIDVAAVSLRDAVDRARTSVFNTYKNAYFDPYEQDPVIDRVEAERGPLDLSCLYNDRRRQSETLAGRTPTEVEIRAALSLAEHRWEHRPDMLSRRLFLTVEDGPDAVDFLLRTDTRYFADADTIALAGEFETVAVQSALSPSGSTGVDTKLSA